LFEVEGLAGVFGGKGERLSFAISFRQASEIGSKQWQRRRGVNDLHRPSRTNCKSGAPDFVPPDDLSQTSFEYCRVAGAVAINCDRFVMQRREIGGSLIETPNLLLRE